MTSVATLTLLAPLDGWCTPLEEVPDPVFAERMLGDGVAIDPVTGVVISPCDGVISAVPPGGHAVSIRTEHGIDVLVHVGIDTVRLDGRGFQTLVRPGQLVRAGEEVIRFDLDGVARTARSLMTPIVVTAMEGLSIRRRHATGPICAGQELLEIELTGDALRPSALKPAAAPVHPVSGEAVSRLTISLLHGLHARPAALLAKRARALNSHVTLTAHGKSADARSVVAMMALGVRHGDEITVTADGAQGTGAIKEILAGLDEALTLERAAANAGDASGATPVARNERFRKNVLQPDAGLGLAPHAGLELSGRELPGVVAVPGFAVGRAARIERPQIAVVEAGTGAEHESAEFTRARSVVRARLSRVGEVGGATRREIVATHLAFLEDPLLNETAQELIAAGKSAAFAWRAATRQSIAALEALGDARLRERADDLLDIESHVLLALAGEARPLNIPLPPNAVVLADELLPSELVALDRDRLAAICLGGGGPTSHVAILAAAMDVPMLVGLGTSLGEIKSGTQLIVDADRGFLHVSPTAAEAASAELRAAKRRADRATELTAAQRECRARDGTRIEVFANLGSVADAEAAVLAGAEGCGLLRTEFLFIDRDRAPDEAEQLEIYQSVAAALAGRPLVLRLMDVGGDKPLKYLPLPPEDNPALGLRGIRTALRHSELLRTQLRAALKVTPVGIVRILLPMITDASEVHAVRAIVDELRIEIGHHAPIEIGAMIETPAAALTAQHIVQAADFLSIGSNDLTQYALAMDRGHAELAGRIDALHPAVLKLIASAASAGVGGGKLVAVCGGVAADPAAVPLLIGLGARELSVVPAAIPALKRQIRSLTVAECTALAARCLEAGSAAEVRMLMAKTLASPGGA